MSRGLSLLPLYFSLLLYILCSTTFLLWSALLSPVSSFQPLYVTRSDRTDKPLPQRILVPGRHDHFCSSILYARIVATSATSGTTSRKKFKSNRWFPKVVTHDDDIFSEDEKAIAEFEQEVVVLTANLIRSRLLQQKFQSTANNTLCVDQIPSSTPLVLDSEKVRIKELVRGRFMDLTCTQSGEDTLERLFYENDQIVHDIWTNATQTTKSMTELQKDDVIRGAVMILQSLCVMGTQVGVKGLPEQLKRMVEHLADQKKASSTEQLLDVYEWTKDSVRRLKHKLDRTAAVQLLEELRWKQTPQGAFDLLVALGVWEKHEDLALLRSGFPLRFTEEEEKVATNVLRNARNGAHDPDPDSLLGIRQDLRHLKVYTIDGASAAEIDDGISIESLLENINNISNGSPEATRQRIWVHIADAESWAPPHSALFEAARRRVTSLYLPNGTISMFPSRIGTELMSLKVNEDVRALSLGVELNDDGSLDVSTLIVTPSLIRVAYRLTYDEVDEMLEEGIAYNEEWEIGALLMAATKRRELRIQNGSAEGLIPNPVPSSSVSIFPDGNAPDSIGISLNIEVSHNAAVNKTASAQATGDGSCETTLEEPVSSAYLLVTEMMILAGEAIGVWKCVQDGTKQESNFDNSLRLPFRGQRRPDFKGRSLERIVMNNLLETNAGSGLCHAWYSRRFLESVSISHVPMPHSGLGLDCYVQWTSPIRRFSDLQVHAAVKRYLRRQRVYDLIQGGEPIPEGVSSLDFGISALKLSQEVFVGSSISSNDLDNDLDYLEGLGLIAAGKKLQRLSQQYWLFEYIRRLKEANPDTTFSVVVLGCVDPDKHQFAIYVKELGLEHRYSSPAGRLEAGAEFRVKVDNVAPRSGLLSFVRVI